LKRMRTDAKLICVAASVNVASQITALAHLA